MFNSRSQGFSVWQLLSFKHRDVFPGIWINWYICVSNVFIFYFQFILHKQRWLSVCVLQFFLFLSFSLKCSHTTAYEHTLAYARKRWYTLGVCLAYAVYAPNTLTYVGVRCVIHRDQLIFWTCSQFISVCERIKYTLLIR